MIPIRRVDGFFARSRKGRGRSEGRSAPRRLGLRKNSIRSKIILISGATSVMALCLAGLSLGVYEYLAVRQMTVGDLEVLSRVVGSNCSAALTFGDRVAAREVLGTLGGVPGVEQAILYQSDGHPFAAYPPDLPMTSRSWSRGAGAESRVRGLDIWLSVPITVDRDTVGRLDLRCRTRHLLPWLLR